MLDYPATLLPEGWLLSLFLVLGVKFVSSVFFSREKIFVTREKNRFSNCEILILPVEKYQKQPVEQKSFP